MDGDRRRGTGPRLLSLTGPWHKRLSNCRLARRRRPYRSAYRSLLVFLPAELPDRGSLLRQREDHAGRGDAAQ